MHFVKTFVGLEPDIRERLYPHTAFFAPWLNPDFIGTESLRFSLSNFFVFAMHLQQDDVMAKLKIADREVSMHFMTDGTSPLACALPTGSKLVKSMSRIMRQVMSANLKATKRGCQCGLVNHAANGALQPSSVIQGVHTQQWTSILGNDMKTIG